MFKILGSLLIVLGAASIGFFKAAQLKTTVNFWQEITNSMIIMKGRIQYSRPEIPQLLCNLSGETKSPTQQFFSNVLCNINKGYEPALSVQNAVNDICKVIKLNTYDADALLGISKVFSAEDVSDAVNNCDSCIDNFKIIAEKATSTEKDRGKLCKTLGVTIGVFAVILFF